MSAQNEIQDDEAGRLQALKLAHMLVVPFTVKAAVTLGVPKILFDAGPGSHFTAEEIAKSISSLPGSSADSENLDRILRVLASHNVVTEIVSVSPKDPRNVQRRYGATSVLKYLTDDKDSVSLAPFLHLLTENATTQFLHLLHAPVLDKNVEPNVLVFGKKSFEHSATDARFDTLFNKAMHDHSHIFVPLLLDTYRGFEDLSSLVDLGGGLGVTLSMILSKYPNIQGINFDQPHVVANGVKLPNLRQVGGDFFESVPEADAVFMKWILHNWDDKACLTILKNIWKALPPHGKVINMDAVLPEVSDPSGSTRLNLYSGVLMMACCSGGKERTLSEIRQLATDAGFKRVELVATVDSLSVIELYKN